MHTWLMQRISKSISTTLFIHLLSSVSLKTLMLSIFLTLKWCNRLVSYTTHLHKNKQWKFYRRQLQRSKKLNFIQNLELKIALFSIKYIYINTEIRTLILSVSLFNELFKQRLSSITYQVFLNTPPPPHPFFFNLLNICHQMVIKFNQSLNIPQDNTKELIGPWD